MKLALASSIRQVDRDAWDACARGKALLRHCFFQALEDSGAIGPGRRIEPCYVTLESDEGQVLAAAPAMTKVGTLTEYGPQWRWLRAGAALGLFRWPKFQVGLPLTAVLGPKLLHHPQANEADVVPALLRGLRRLAFDEFQLDALDVQHIDAAAAARVIADGWLVSHEVHSFWCNAGHDDYPSYLLTLPHRTRNAIRRERRRLAEGAIDVRLISGCEISPSLMDHYYEGHRLVCARYGNRPWLPRAFWTALLQAMPESIVLAAAFEGDRLLAGSLWIIDGDTLCLRTWSAQRPVPGLLMELICHRPIEFAISRRLAWIDSGLSSAHKRTRGFADRRVYTAHCFRQAGLRDLARHTLEEIGQHPWQLAPAQATRC